MKFIFLSIFLLIPLYLLGFYINPIDRSIGFGISDSAINIISDFTLRDYPYIISVPKFGTKLRISKINVKFNQSDILLNINGSLLYNDITINYGIIDPNVDLGVIHINGFYCDKINIYPQILGLGKLISDDTVCSILNLITNEIFIETSLCEILNINSSFCHFQHFINGKIENNHYYLYLKI